MIFSIYDSCAQIYGALIVLSNENVAYRWFENLVKSGKIEENVAKDCSLYCLGLFDDTKGTFDVYPPRKIVDGAVFLEVK